MVQSAQSAMVQPAQSAVVQSAQSAVPASVTSSDTFKGCSAQTLNVTYVLAYVECQSSSYLHTYV